jgi:hypothetical protein
MRRQPGLPAGEMLLVVKTLGGLVDVVVDYER